MIRHEQLTGGREITDRHRERNNVEDSIDDATQGLERLRNLYGCEKMWLLGELKPS
jgi:hypothetical protein